MPATLTTSLPITVIVGANNAVSVESDTRLVGMSCFSERAARIASAFGTDSTHVMATEEDIDDLPESVRVELADALDIYV